MRHRSRPQAAKIEAEYQARRAAAAQAAQDKRDEREMAAAVSVVETELGPVVIL